jgi:hypothetical protein
MLYVITQRTENFDNSKSLTPKYIKVISTWHMNLQLS